MSKALRVLLPVLLLGAAALGGAAAGDLLRAPAGEDRTAQAAADGEAGAHVAPGAEEADPAPQDAGEAHGGGGGHGNGEGEHGGAMSYLEFPQQFFVPIVRGGELRAVMILALSLEIPGEMEEAFFRQEHRLRDALLRSLLIHANSGGFDGNFTAEARLGLLRETLLAEARKVGGPAISAVLIGDIARQEQ